MNEEFEKLKAAFGTTNPQKKGSKQGLKVSLCEADIKEFAGKHTFSFDLACLEDSHQKLGPHGHTGATYVLEWNTRSYPLKLSLKNKAAGKAKELKDCPDYLQEYILAHIQEFATALQASLNLNKEQLINKLYDEEEKQARLTKDEM